MADPAAPRRLSPNLIALLVLVALVGGLVAWQRPWQSRDADTTFPADPVAALRTVLDEMSAASDADDFSRATGGVKWSAKAWDAAEQLGVADISWEYVRGATAPDKADGSTVAVVQVQWDRGEGSVLGDGLGSDTVGLRVRPDDGTFDVVGVEAGDRPLPIWLLGEIDVTKDADTTLVRVDGGGEELLDQQLVTAKEAVDAVVPNASDRLVVLAPATAADAAALLGRKAKDISQIAAVTARVGAGTDAVTAIVLNPDQFADMDGHAQQVVLSHEATHMLTGGVGSPAAAWVLEGFADFVAFHGDEQPVSVNARQGLATVRAEGPPQRLPVSGDFQNSTHGLGALYEQNWLLFRMLGERFGTASVVAFYRDVLEGTQPDKALNEHFDVTPAELVTQWQQYLVKLAE